MAHRTRTLLLGLLILFLPLSAWLVSVTGHASVSVVRDILLLVVVAISFCLPRSKKLPSLALTPLALLILVTLLSYLGRQDSVLQWLRGVRYLLEPFILLGTLLIWPVSADDQPVLAKWLVVSIGLVLLGGLLDYFFPTVLRYSLNTQAVGYLGQVHFADGSVRLQSILAGPNALGLYLMFVLATCPWWLQTVNKWLGRLLVAASIILLALTFSRSSYSGAFVALVILLVFGWRLLPRDIKNMAVAILLLGIIATTSVFAYRPGIIDRVQSDAMRLTQYQRVWDERNQIGWLGRGAGTTGLVSEYSFDNSPNHFSENSYLDTYENIGPVGLLALLGVWLAVVFTLARRKTIGALSAVSAVAALLVAGLFIDYYTGQAALWLTVVVTGLATVGSELHKISMSQPERN